MLRSWLLESTPRHKHTLFSIAPELKAPCSEGDRCPWVIKADVRPPDSKMKPQLLLHRQLVSFNSSAATGVNYVGSRQRCLEMQIDSVRSKIAINTVMAGQQNNQSGLCINVFDGTSRATHGSWHVSNDQSNCEKSAHSVQVPVQTVCYWSYISTFTSHLYPLKISLASISVPHKEVRWIALYCHSRVMCFNPPFVWCACLTCVWLAPSYYQYTPVRNWLLRDWLASHPRCSIPCIPWCMAFLLDKRWEMDWFLIFFFNLHHYGDPGQALTDVRMHRGISRQPLWGNFFL